MNEDRRPHILIAGGGYVGLYTTFGLRRLLQRRRVRVTVVDPLSYMTYQPFLAEAAAGSVEPRHVIVPLRQVLPRADIVNGRVVKIEHARKVALVETKAGPVREIGYDHVVVALGSISRTLPIPGLAEEGIGFKWIEEAIGLRNRVLDMFDLAASTDDPATRRRALTFVVVGGGFAGVEALGELEDLAHDALRLYPKLNASDMRWILVEATDRILPEVGAEMGRYTVERLRERRIEVKLGTLLTSCVDKHVVLSDGDEFDASAIIWTAGVKASPVLQDTDLPVDERGRLRANPSLTVVGHSDAWTAGDCAAVPDLTRPGEFCAPTAQHAVRQARLLARNIERSLQHRPLRDYKHKYVGSLASLGLHKGVAQAYGVKVRGWPAWFMHRTYHVSRVPTLNRKTRIVLDWTLALFFRRDVAALGSLQSPYRVFRAAAVPTMPHNRGTQADNADPAPPPRTTAQQGDPR
jgi:NADH dehydrogenase